MRFTIPRLPASPHSFRLPTHEWEQRETARFLEACRWSAPRQFAADTAERAALQKDYGPDLRSSIRRFSTAADAKALDAAVTRALPSGSAHRLVASAGALYGLTAYRFSAREWIFYGDVQAALPAPDPVAVNEAIFEQIEGPYDLLVLCADLPRYTNRYGPRGLQFAWLEAGATLALIETDLRQQGIGLCWIGGFDDARIAALAGAGPGQHPLICLAAGMP